MFQPPPLGRKYVFSGSQNFVHWSVDEAELETREGSREGRCEDGHDGMLKAPTTLRALSSESFITEAVQMSCR